MHGHHEHEHERDVADAAAATARLRGSPHEPRFEVCRLAGSYLQPETVMSQSCVDKQHHVWLPFVQHFVFSVCLSHELRMHSVAPALVLFWGGSSGGFVPVVVRSPGLQATRTTNAMAIDVKSDFMRAIINA